MVYSFAWDETSPAGSSNISLGDDRIREFKTTVRQALADEHGDLTTYTTGPLMHLWKVVSKSTGSPYTLLYSDHVAEVTTGSSANYAINLPTAVSLPGKPYKIKKIDSGTKSVVITPNGADTIEGAASLTIYSQYGYVVLVSDGVSNWMIFAFNDVVNPQGLGAISGRTVKVASTSSITVSAKAVGLFNPSNNLCYTTFSPSVTINTGTSGANGLDTGSMAQNTWYSVWLIYNPTTQTVAGLISLNATTPTLPSGYTYQRRVGWVRTAASSTNLITTWGLGSTDQYINSGSGLPVMDSGAKGSIFVPTWVAVATGNFVPSTASRISVFTHHGGTIMVAPNNSYGAYSSTTNPPLIVVNIVGWNGFPLSMTLESTNIYWANDGVSASLFCYGWEDNL
jgi:hypothetical protein